MADVQWPISKISLWPVAEGRCPTAYGPVGLWPMAQLAYDLWPSWPMAQLAYGPVGQ